MIDTGRVAGGSPAARTGRLPALTALRFLAALAVLFSHLVFLGKLDNPLRPVAETLFREGFTGVTFFFVLSGFILAHTYQDPLAAGRISRRRYFLLRMARIYPLHLLTAVPFVAGALSRHGPEAVPGIAVNLALLQSWVPASNTYFSLNVVSWSLSNELFFYACFPLLVACSSRVLAGLVVVWVCAIGAGAAVCIARGQGGWMAGGELQASHWLFYIHPLTRLLDFMVGVVLYRACAGAAAGRPLRHATRHEAASLLLLLLAMAAFSSLHLPDVLRSQLLYLPFVAYVIAVYARGAGALSRRLASPTLVMLGEASFALYMIHRPIITVGYGVYRDAGMPFSPVLLAALLVIACVAASVVVYRYVEKPLHDWLRRLIMARADGENGGPART